MSRDHRDKAVIDALGGPAKVARLLGYDTASGGIQRVQNWMTRGIPHAVRLKHIDIFGAKSVDAELGASKQEAA
jgi:hypothetical protein